MTSRPPLAIPPRQPQRTLGGSGLSQRPVSQRSLTQQYAPQSPVRRPDGFGNEHAADGGDGAQPRYGTTPRRGGSKLKLELANDGIDHAGFVESPQNADPLSASKVFTPSRVMSMADAPDLGDMSPQTSRCHTIDSDSAPLPMPPRRARFAVPAKRFQPPPANAPVKKDARSKPFTLEAPPEAPRYWGMGKQEQCGYADFSPWRGGHPEDQFSDNIIRIGYFDKAPTQPGQEAASAKATLFPALKHKSGLHTLSTVFTTILNHRRYIGQITSPSTFKPPPRVTLTDTKREAWLKDLANPTIPLRRLSRTIPHGIRGRVLLEQCLNKNVPTDRAVWLAKCVGANEIRAFKRKGVNNTFVMGGEVKWIRDWTLCVEQFVEAIISAFTEADWKAKVTYAIRLATHLYAEHLLDRDHYMEWLVASLEGSNEAKLPMWLLLVQIYWKDMLKLRRHGRRLATAILSHHCSIYESPDRDILLPLSNQLGALVKSLISASPDSFVHPTTWSRFRDSLQTFLSSGQESTYNAFKTIDSRTDSLTSSNVRTRPAIRSTLVALLDNMLRLPFKDDIPGQIHKATKNTPVLIRTTLEWCTSLYRFGTAKVYIAVAILRSISDPDTDLTGEILGFLDADALQESPRKHSIYHLISELVRSGHFSVPQYIQWLIARGGLLDPSGAQPDGPCSMRLLVEIPTHSFNDSMKSLRASLLRRASFSVEDEAKDIGTAIKCIKYALSVPLDPGDPILQKPPMSIKKLAKRISLSSRSLKFEVCSWLANDFINSIVQQLRTEKTYLEPPERCLDIVRTLLEAAQDFSMLNTTLGHMTNSSNVETLSYCVNTLSLHLPVFFAMGSAKSLFHSFYDRLRTVSVEQGVGARPLLASLANLAPRLPGLETMASQLRNELLLADRSNAVDASSPLSDNMATQLQDDETELGEQIEKLANYTSADKHTMERLFHTIVSKLVVCWAKSHERQRPYSILLSRLRVFDTQYFDTLMKDWVQHIRKLTKRAPIAQMYPLLVSSGCLSLTTLLATALRTQNQGPQTQPSAVGSASTYMQEILQMLMKPFDPDQILTLGDCYRFQIIQAQARLEYAKEVMLLVRGSLAEYAASRNQQPPRPQPLDDEKVKSHLFELLRDLILIDPQAASQTLSLRSPDAKLATLIEALTTKLLVPQCGGGQKTFEQVLELANEFTLPFCQVKLSLNLAIHDPSTPEGAERLQTQFEQLSIAMDNAIEADNIMWTGMLSYLSLDITLHLKNRAEARFLDLFPSMMRSLPFDEARSKGDIHMAENLLTVVDSVLRGASTSRISPFSGGIAEKLTELWEILSSTSDECTPLKSAVLAHWLPLLLSYLALQASQFSAAVDSSRLPGSDTRARVLVILAGIVLELDKYPASHLGPRVFDIGLVLVDNLPEEARLQCMRAVKDYTTDPRLRYLFSFSPDPAENFMLAHREKPPTMPERKLMALNLGMGMPPEKLTPFTFRRWEILNEPTPSIGDNDTSLSLTLFDARKI